MAQVVIAGRIHPAGMAILEAEPGLGIDAITDPGAALPPEKLAAADALLIRYGALTEEQAAYIGVPVAGPYKADTYRY